MSPLLREADRADAVLKFIVAKSKNLAQISDYKKIKDYLEDKKVENLCDLKKSGAHQENSWSPRTTYFTEGDAVEYVEWLISASLGTANVSDEISKKATDQLFMFIFALNDALESAENLELLVPCSLDKRFENFDDKIDRINDKIIDALEKIHQWQKAYQPSLDELKKEREERGDMENSLKGNGNDGKKRKA